MSITAERRQELIKEHARQDGDTGSPEVQVAILTERIRNLTEHFKGHAKDNHFSARRTGIATSPSSRSSVFASDTKGALAAPFAYPPLRNPANGHGRTLALHRAGRTACK